MLFFFTLSVSVFCLFHFRLFHLFLRLFYTCINVFNLSHFRLISFLIYSSCSLFNSSFASLSDFPYIPLSFFISSTILCLLSLFPLRCAFHFVLCYFHLSLFLHWSILARSLLSLFLKIFLSLFHLLFSNRLLSTIFNSYSFISFS